MSSLPEITYSFTVIFLVISFCSCRALEREEAEGLASMRREIPPGLMKQYKPAGKKRTAEIPRAQLERVLQAYLKKQLENQNNERLVAQLLSLLTEDKRSSLKLPFYNILPGFQNIEKRDAIPFVRPGKRNIQSRRNLMADLIPLLMMSSEQNGDSTKEGDLSFKDTKTILS
uniref:Uncharacterized protein n=1 Tax=Clytia hemisphaerica TaxID=252671 RepID=A0A7M5XLP0_9CNID